MYFSTYNLFCIKFILFLMHSHKHTTLLYTVVWEKFVVENTIRGKILEGENFGELMALNSLARKKLANLLVVY